MIAGEQAGSERPEQVEKRRVLVDSSLWIEYYHPQGRPEHQAALQEALGLGRVATTAIILIEVLRGALTRESYQSLEVDFTALHWLDATPEVAHRGAEMGFELERRGRRVPATDLMVAAAALEYDCTLWHNDGHFESIAESTALDQLRLR